MNERDVDGNGSVDAERLRRLRLSEFLRDLVRQEGKMEAAELLGVNHKTLTRAEESGEITGRMGDALERLLVLELAMLEEHGLTLPPETQALRGFGRKGQINHRWKALADTRVALRKRKLLRWVRTVLTLWLWRK